MKIVFIACVMVLAACTKKELQFNNTQQSGEQHAALSLKQTKSAALNSNPGYINVSYNNNLYQLVITTNLPGFVQGGSMTYYLTVSVSPGGFGYSQEVNTKTVTMHTGLNNGDVVNVFVSYGGETYSTQYLYSNGTTPPTQPPVEPDPVTPAPWGSGFQWNISSNTQNTNVNINWNWENGQSDLYYYFLFQVYNADLNHYYTIYDSTKAMSNSKSITINRYYTSYNSIKIDFWVAGARYKVHYPANEYDPGNPQNSRYIAMGGNVGQFYTHGFATYSFPYTLNGFPPSE